MKKLFCRSEAGLFVCVASSLWLTLTTVSGVTFSVTPAVVSNTYSGLITLSIGGLTNGETVLVQKYIDANGNGLADAGEPMADSFRVTDGGAFAIGGVTNYNVPFDSNPAPGAIAAAISIAPPRSLGNLSGQFVFSLSSPVGNFSPLTATLAITNAALAQSVSGIVYSNGVAPLPGAVVAVLEMSGGNNGGGRWAGGAITDINGHYQVSLPPGSYGVMPTSPGCFTDQSQAAQVALTSGMSAVHNLFLSNATMTISGRVTNASNGSGVPGLMMPIEGGNLFAIGFTDSNGNFSIGAAPGSWKLKVDSESVIERALVVPQDKIMVDTSTGSVAGVSISLWKATGLIYGTFTNAAGLPMADIQFSADDMSGQYGASGFTDSNGHYWLGVLGGIGDWFCSPDNNNPALAAYIVSQSSSTNINAGQAVPLNFTALAATGQISGHVQDNLGRSVAGLGIIGDTTINGVAYSSYVDTDAGGNYSLSAASGVWTVMANCCGNDGLERFGLTDPAQTDARIRQVTLPPANAVANLTLYPYGTPTLTQPARYGQSGFVFLLVGAPGTNYTVQVCTNLASGSWSTIQTTNLAGNYGVIQDDQATNSARFYRAVIAH